MNGRYLLDTNLIIALFANDAAVTQHVAAADVYVPSIVIGELSYGARRSGRVAANVARIGTFAAASVILPCTIETARHYGALKELLRASGRPIPENDLWIAAIAQEHGLTLATRDEHFEAMTGLTLQRW